MIAHVKCCKCNQTVKQKDIREHLLRKHYKDEFEEIFLVPNNTLYHCSSNCDAFQRKTTPILLSVTGKLTTNALAPNM